MSIYAIAIDRTKEEALYRLVNQDGTIKVATLSVINKAGLKVGNIKADNNIIKAIPEIVYRGCQNNYILTIIDRNYETYRICNFDGKTAECRFEDIERIEFTNAELITYINYLGVESKAFKFVDESYKECVDKLIDDGLAIRAKLSNGRLNKLVSKINLMGDSAIYNIDENGKFRSTGDDSRAVEKFIIPQGVRVVESLPLCKELIAPSTIEEFILKEYTSLTKIDLGNCDLITDYKAIESLIIGSYELEEIVFPKHISTLTRHNRLRKLRSITIGEYIEVIEDNCFDRLTLVELNCTYWSRLKKIGSRALVRSKKFFVNFEDCVCLESIGFEAFKSCKDESDLDLSKCVNLISIGDKAFSDYTGEVIKLPDNLKTIGEHSFDHLSASINFCIKDVKTLKYINIPRKINKNSIHNLCSSINLAAKAIYSRFNGEIDVTNKLVVDIPVNVSNKYAESMERLNKINRAYNSLIINIVH